MPRNEIAGGRNHYYWKQSAFSAGEFSPEVSCRDDVDRYNFGAKEITNFIPSPFGGVKRRPGMRFVNEAGNMSQKVRLVPFIYNESVSFMLEFGHGYVRVYRKDGLIYNGNNPVQVSTPYQGSDLFGLKFTQSADTLFICHKNYPVKTLFRNSDTNWTLSDFQFIEGPFTQDNTSDITVTPSGTTGTVTLTASEDIFTAGMVGGLMRISHEVLGQSYTYSGRGAWTGTALKCNGDWSFVAGDPWTTTIVIEQSNDNGATWAPIKHINLWENGSPISDSGSTDHYCLIRARSGGSSDGAGSLALSCSSFIQDGYVKITGYTDARTVTAVVQTDPNNYIYALGDNKATRLWSIGSWNNDYGYPATPAFYQDRLCFASTKREPLGFWASNTGDYNRFRVQSEVQDDDAISVTLVSGRANEVLNMVSLNALLCFTYGSEWRINSGTGRSSLTPTTINAAQQSAEGSNNVPPLIINDRMLFITKLGDSVRDFAYDYSYDSYKGTDQTLYSRHLFENHKIVDWAYQKSPDEVIWCVRDDGALLSFTYIYDEKIYSWAKHETDGYVESVASIPGDNKDELFLVVRRTINGSTKRYVERLEEHFTSGASDDSMLYFSLLDSHLLLNDPHNITSISGNATSITMVLDSAIIGLVVGDEVTLRGNYADRYDGLRLKVTSVSGTTVVTNNPFGITNFASEVTPVLRKVYHSFGGLQHLEGKQVRLYGDGSDMGLFTVKNGKITSDVGASSACIGLDYESRLQTLDIQIPTNNGNSRGRKKRIVRPKLELNASWGGEVGINGYDHMEPMSAMPNGLIRYDTLGKAPETYNGLKEVEPMSTVCDNCTITVRQSRPFPLGILNIMAEVVLSD